MKKELEQIFMILKTGNQEEVKAAKKHLDKLWHSNSKNFKRNATIVLEEMKEFDRISNYKNQEAFVSGLSLFFLVLADSYFDELKKFVLKVICHSNGHVREQMRKTADWLYVSLSARIHPFVWPQSKKLTQKQIEEQEKAKQELIEYLSDLENLMRLYEQEGDYTVEFIQDLKPSIFKSLHLLWGDLNRGKLLQYLHSPSTEIIEKREELEKKLTKIVKKTRSDISLEDIKAIIYNETEGSELNNLIRTFSGGSLEELQNTINTLNDAWNYFPHRVLNGLCPVEIVNRNKQERLLN